MYGRNASAGGIYVITAKPDLDATEASVSVGTGDLDLVEHAETGPTVNIDLPGTMTLRSQTGFYTNNFTYPEDRDGTQFGLGNWASHQESTDFQVGIKGTRPRTAGVDFDHRFSANRYEAVREQPG